MRKSISSLKSAALVAAILVSPSIALADEPVEVVIEFADAELETANGVETVLNRVSLQAKDACSTVRAVTRASKLDRLCYANVMKQATDVLFTDRSMIL